MADPLATHPYSGWTAAEIKADQALTASTRALSQADGLLDPSLDPILARARPATVRHGSRYDRLGPRMTGPTPTEASQVGDRR